MAYVDFGRVKTLYFHCTLIYVNHGVIESVLLDETDLNFEVQNISEYKAQCISGTHLVYLFH